MLYLICARIPLTLRVKPLWNTNRNMINNFLRDRKKKLIRNTISLSILLSTSILVFQWRFNVTRANSIVKSSDKNSANSDVPAGERLGIFRPNDHVSVIYDGACWLWKVVFEPRLELKVQRAAFSAKDVPIGINQTMKLNLFLSHVRLL